MYRIQKKDIPRAGMVLKDAFRDDPVWKAMFENEPAPDQKLLSFFTTPVLYCSTYGEALAVSENLEGISGSVPGRYAEMTAWRMLRSGAIWAGMKTGMKLAMKMKTVFDPMLADRKKNMKGRDYLYLLIIGVAQEHQGRGLGKKLLQNLFDRSKSTNAPVYLETETEGNAAMYEKLGFQVIQKITLPIIGLPMWEMVREPTA